MDLSKAWSSRILSRPPVLRAVDPKGTLTASVTGTECVLGCSHCNGRYLEHMVDLGRLEDEIRKKRPKSVLLSGGCDDGGQVPLEEGIRQVDALRRRLESEGLGFRLNVHPGVASTRLATLIADLADVVSFDFVLDADTIGAAFHGRWTGQEYIRTLRDLCRGRAQVVPHILLGLHKGEIKGERQALDFLLGEGFRRLIFIVFIPTSGTLWENLAPPAPEEVAEIIAETRISSPELDISLGCMRPGGPYRKKLDPLAVLAGVDRIVLPGKGALATAEEKGLRVVWDEECCAFE